MTCKIIRFKLPREEWYFKKKYRNLTGEHLKFTRCSKCISGYNLSIGKIMRNIMYLRLICSVVLLVTTTWADDKVELRKYKLQIIIIIFFFLFYFSSKDLFTREVYHTFRVMDFTKTSSVSIFCIEMIVTQRIRSHGPLFENYRHLYLMEYRKIASLFKLE